MEASCIPGFIPFPISISRLIGVYNSNIMLNLDMVKFIFKDQPEEVLNKLFARAKLQAAHDGLPICADGLVWTSSAYKAWGFDIKDLQSRLFNRLIEELLYKGVYKR